MPSEVSVLILTLNEEQHVESAVAAGLAVSDDVVVVDSGSRDATREIAAAAGARVLENAWLGFSGQRNWGASHCLHDHVLVLDADESLDSELVASIKRIPASAAGYVVRRRSQFMGDWHRPMHRDPLDRQLRLYNRHRARWDGRAVHEKVIVEGDVVLLEGSILHRGYRGLQDYVERLHRYAVLLADEEGPHTSKLQAPRLWARPAAHVAYVIVRHRVWRDGWRGWILAALWGYHDFLVEAHRYAASLSEEPRSGSRRRRRSRR